MRLLSFFRWTFQIAVIMLISVSSSSCQVSFSQGTSDTEPLYADHGINYNIPITNNKTSTNTYSAAITVGPDKDNISINLTSYSKWVFVNPGETKIETICVDFYDSALNKSEFNIWLKHRNDTSVWEKAWYRVEISPFLGQSDVYEDYSGSPKLIKPICEYLSPTVTPTHGTSSDNYTYSIVANCGICDNISLEIASTREGPWINKGIQSYTNPGLNQILSWSNISLGFKHDTAYYRFKGIMMSQPEAGPFRCQPEAGSFRYVSAKNVHSSITLNLNDLNNFNNLSINNINLTLNDITFLNRVLNRYSDLKMSLEDIEANVTPANGTMYTPFTYSFSLKSPMEQRSVVFSKGSEEVALFIEPDFDIELEIQPPNDHIWRSQGKQTYSTSDRSLKWPNLSFISYSEVFGKGKYRFVIDGETSVEFLGPEIDVAVRNELFALRPDDNFDYFAEVKSSRPMVDMELMYTDDGVTWKRSGQIRKYILGNNSSTDPPWVTFSWLDQPWHKSIRVDER